MRARHSLIAIFSTFIEFELGRFSRWVTDVRLCRSMEQHWTESGHSQLSETLWANYWYCIYQQQSTPKTTLAKGHLAAYLQETCYWVTQKILKLLPTGQLDGGDCFQLAIAELDHILLKYEPHRGSSLKGFAAIAYPRLLRDILRRRKTAEISTDPTLLMRTSKRCFLGALRRAGLSQTEMAHYRLAWTCFKAVYGQQPPLSPSGAAAKSVDWQAIARLYNAERLHQLEPTAPSLNATTANVWLSQCAKWVRLYLCPTILSLDVPAGGNVSELQNTVTPLADDSLLNELIHQEDRWERQLKQAEVKQVLVEGIAALKSDQQSLLRLYYQDQLTQQQIAQRLNLKQYAISRQLTRIRSKLLKRLVSHLQSEVDNSLHKPLTVDLSNHISPILEEWLTHYYGTCPE